MNRHDFRGPLAATYAILRFGEFQASSSPGGRWLYVIGNRTGGRMLMEPASPSSQDLASCEVSNLLLYAIQIPGTANLLKRCGDTTVLDG